MKQRRRTGIFLPQWRRWGKSNRESPLPQTKPRRTTLYVQALLQPLKYINQTKKKNKDVDLPQYITRKRNEKYKKKIMLCVLGREIGRRYKKKKETHLRILCMLKLWIVISRRKCVWLLASPAPWDSLFGFFFLFFIMLIIYIMSC